MDNRYVRVRHRVDVLERQLIDNDSEWLRVELTAARAEVERLENVVTVSGEVIYE